MTTKEQAKTLDDLMGRRLKNPQAERETVERIAEGMRALVKKYKPKGYYFLAYDDVVNTLIHFYNIGLDDKMIQNFVENTAMMDKDLTFSYYISEGIGSLPLPHHSDRITKAFAKSVEWFTKRAENEFIIMPEGFSQYDPSDWRPKDNKLLETKLEEYCQAIKQVKKKTEKNTITVSITAPTTAPERRKADSNLRYRSSVVERAVELGAISMVSDSKTGKNTFDDVIGLFELIAEYNNNHELKAPAATLEFNYTHSEIIRKMKRDAENFINTFGYIDMEFLRISGEIHRHHGNKFLQEHYPMPRSERLLYDIYIKKIIEQGDIVRESSEKIKTRLQEAAKGKERIFDISDIMEEMYTGMQSAQDFIEVSELEHETKDYPTLEQHAIMSVGKWYEVFEKLPDFEKTNIKLIDLGCGDGKKAIAIAKRLQQEYDTKVVINFVDLSDDMLHTAKRNAYLEGIEAVADKLNLKEFFSPKFENVIVEDSITNIFKQSLKPYFTVLKDTERYGPENTGPNVLLFLGQTIGNFASGDVVGYLQLMAQMANMVIIEADLSKEENIDKYTKSTAMMQNYLTKAIPKEAIMQKDGKSTFEILPLETTGGDVIAQYTITKNTAISYKGDTIRLCKGDTIITAKSRKFTEEYLTSEISPTMIERLKTNALEKVKRMYGSEEDPDKEQRLPFGKTKAELKFDMRFGELTIRHLKQHILPESVTRDNNKIYVTYFGTSIPLSLGYRDGTKISPANS